MKKVDTHWHEHILFLPTERYTDAQEANVNDPVSKLNLVLKNYFFWTSGLLKRGHYCSGRIARTQ